MACMTAMYLTALLAFTVYQCRALQREENQLIFNDCNHVKEAGYSESGVYMLRGFGNESYQVFCEHGYSNSYTVIQRRIRGNVNFVQKWQKYQSGFGDPQGDYWAGLNIIYLLTTRGHNVLNIHMQDWDGNNRNVRYSYFKLQDSTNFILNIGGFRGDVPDDLSFNNNSMFATYDRPDYVGCATNQKAGWWYGYCSHALPNGKYYHGGSYSPTEAQFFDGIYWKAWKGFNYSLKYIQMTLSTS